MQGSMTALRRAIIWIYVFTAFLFGLSLLLAVQDRLDLGLFFTAMFSLGISGALREMRAFCEGALQRIRELSAMA